MLRMSNARLNIDNYYLIDYDVSKSRKLYFGTFKGLRNKIRSFNNGQYRIKKEKPWYKFRYKDYHMNDSVSSERAKSILKTLVGMGYFPKRSDIKSKYYIPEGFISYKFSNETKLLRMMREKLEDKYFRFYFGIVAITPLTERLYNKYKSPTSLYRALKRNKLWFDVTGEKLRKFMYNPRRGTLKVHPEIAKNLIGFKRFLAWEILK
jgi:hypothetical protein